MALLSTDPIDILLGADGDLDLSSGGLEWSRGIAGVAQGCRIAMQAVKGEWFLNLDDGISYYENDVVPASRAILGQRFDEIKALAEYRTALLGVPGVGKVLALVVDYNSETRALSVSWQVKTEFGDTVAGSLEVGV